jgi:hypothetical protein
MSHKQLIQHIITIQKLPDRFFEYIFNELKKEHTRELRIFTLPQICELKTLSEIDSRKKIYSILNSAVYPSRMIAFVSGTCNFTQSELEDLCGDMFSDQIESFVIFGCKESTDIDVACIIKYDDKCCNGKSPLLKSRDIKRLENELSEMGYNISRGIDYNVISIYDGKIKSLSKGGNGDTANMILYTYANHIQKYALPKLNFVDVPLFDKIRGLSSFFIQNLESLVRDYKGIRNEKIIVCEEGTDAIVIFSRNINKLIDFDRRHELHWKDAMKSIVMKYCQLILLTRSEYEYDKTNLALKTS